MADLPSYGDLQRIARDEILSSNSRLTRDAVEREGADANAFAAGAAAVADEGVGQLARLEASLFLGTSRGKCLDRLIYDRYGLTRKPASPARGSVQFSTTASNPTPFNIPAETRLQTSDGKQFQTVVSAVFPSGSTGPITVEVRSSKAGLDQHSKIGTITNVVDPPTGAPSDLAVTNAVATFGADNEETDDAYADRARLFWESARRGTNPAIEAQALAVPGIRKATIFEYLDNFGRPAGASQLVIADAFTDQLAEQDEDPPTYQAQSLVLTTTVFNSLSDTRPTGTFIDVFVAQVILQGVTLGLSFRAGFNVDSVALQARAAVANYINELRPGENLVPGNLIDVLRKVNGLVITENEILSPTGTVVANQLQVLRATLGLVVASSVQPDQALQGSANPDAVGTA